MLVFIAQMASDVPTRMRQLRERNILKTLGAELREITKKTVKRSYFDTPRSKIDSL
jgi:hypothetical protein